LAGHALVDESVAHFDALRAQALERRCDAGLDVGERDVLLPRIEAAVAEYPFHERFRGQLALGLYRAGRQRDALAALANARRALAEDVGLEPGAELRQLEARILEQDPSLDAAPASPTASSSVLANVVAPAPASPSEPAAAGPYLARALLHRAELRADTAAGDRQRAGELIERLDLRLLRRQLAASA